MTDLVHRLHTGFQIWREEVATHASAPEDIPNTRWRMVQAESSRSITLRSAIHCGRALTCRVILTDRMLWADWRIRSFMLCIARLGTIKLWETDHVCSASYLLSSLPFDIKTCGQSLPPDQKSQCLRCRSESVSGKMSKVNSAGRSIEQNDPWTRCILLEATFDSCLMLLRDRPRLMICAIFIQHGLVRFKTLKSSSLPRKASGAPSKFSAFHTQWLGTHSLKSIETVHIQIMATSGGSRSCVSSPDLVGGGSICRKQNEARHLSR
jgi:hypothetical protein